MWVDSHDEWALVADFDPGTGWLREVPRVVSGAPEGHTNGHFAVLSGAATILYRFDGALWLRLGDHARDLDQPHVDVTLRRQGKRRALRLLEHGRIVGEATYTVHVSSADWASTAFARPEHWDFGEFVVNVLTDPGRRARIFREVP